MKDEKLSCAIFCFFCNRKRHIPSEKKKKKRKKKNAGTTLGRGWLDCSPQASLNESESVGQGSRLLL